MPCPYGFEQSLEVRSGWNRKAFSGRCGRESDRGLNVFGLQRRVAREEYFSGLAGRQSGQDSAQEHACSL
jgi:hypothetical protein